MTFDPSLLLFILGISTLILYLVKLKRCNDLEDKNKQLENTARELDEQARIIIKTDLVLNKVQEELDKKITGLYTLHELGKKINSTFNIEDLFLSINEPLIFKLGFSKAIIMLKSESSGKITAKTYVGYSSSEISEIENKINKGSVNSSILKKDGVLLVNKSLKKVDQEDMLLDIFNAESFLTVPIVVKDEAMGFILMGDASNYSKVTEGDAELLSVLASQIGTAIENTSLYTELFNSHKELERRVKERTAELAKLNEELNRLNKVKSDFVSAVSHELRTPLTSIKGYASILMAGKLGNVLPEQKERLEKIDKHSNHLTHLINNLLSIARIESGRVQMDIKQLSIKDAVDSAVDIIMPQIKEKNISLKIDINTKMTAIKADPGQLERVFLNLLSNAIKFSPEKGKIAIQVKEKGEYIEFSVEDTGIGIPEQDLEKVFEEFFRSENAQDQKVKGTGLGLSLVKKIIEAHKGRIWAESQIGKGTRFIFTIPTS